MSDDFANHVRTLLNYCPVAGVFTWKKFRGNTARAGSIAGAIDSKGHRQIRVSGKLYGAHRLAWLVTHNRWPDVEIDHINRQRDDNRLCNLRECTHLENSQNIGIYANNTSGVRGVHYHQPTKKYRAYLTVARKRKSLGYYDCMEDAAAARKVAELKYHSFAAEASS